MNIIFLDIDGVICNPSTCIAVGNRGIFSYIDPISTLLLRRLCEETNSKLVISSTWRKHYNKYAIEAILNAACANLGDYVYDDETYWRTPILNTIRGEEIGSWIVDNSSKFEEFVILDDDSDMETFMDSLVKTHQYNGFCFEDYAKAKKMLIGE